MIFKRASVNDVKRMFEHIRDKFSEISSGAASTLLGQNLTANKVLVSDTDGKVTASETDANEIVYFYGSSDEVNAALEAGDLEVGTNIYCEDDTEFEPSYNITENRAVITNTDGEFAPSDVTATELEYLSGVTGNVQEQIDWLNSVVQITEYGTPTGSASMNINDGRVYKNGNIINLWFDITATPTTNFTDLIHVKEEYRPCLAHITTIACGSDNFNYAGTIHLNKNLNNSISLGIYSEKTGSIMRFIFSLSYLVENIIPKEGDKN